MQRCNSPPTAPSQPGSFSFPSNETPPRFNAKIPYLTRHTACGHGEGVAYAQGAARLGDSGHESENEVSWDEEEAILQSVDVVDDLVRSKITARAELGASWWAASARVVQSVGVGVSRDPVGGWCLSPVCGKGGGIGISEGECWGKRDENKWLLVHSSKDMLVLSRLFLECKAAVCGSGAC